MASEQLNLAVTGAPLPPDFIGSPQEFFEAILTRMRVIFPTGQTSFVISDTEPSTNLGPWLKGGTQWYVWDEDTKRYIPLDISPSVEDVVVISDTAPATGEKPLWLQIKGTRVVRWNAWITDAWKPLYNRGTTGQRPSDPVEYERYEDTTIKTEIVFYEAAWHTVAGSPGDIKMVKWPTLAEALQYNPGWQEIGANFASDDARGRALTAAHKDPGGSPVATFPPAAGITARAAGDKFGSETHALSAAEAANQPHQHVIGVPNGGGTNYVTFKRLSAAQTFNSSLTGTGGYVIRGSGGDGTFADPATGELVTSNAIAAGAAAVNTAHNNLAPSMALWTLVKL